MNRTLTPNPFKRVERLNTEFHLSYNKKSKMLTIEEIHYHSFPRTLKAYKQVFTFSGATEDEYYNLTFIDCLHKVNSQTHTDYKMYTYCY